MFCRQGISAAYTKLKELIANHTTLAAQASVTPPAPDTNSDVAMPPSKPSQAEQELVACKEDIVGLIQGVNKQLKEELYTETVPGYESFDDIALAFELPSVYEELLKDKLEVSTFAFVNLSSSIDLTCRAPSDPALPLPCLALPCLALPCLASKSFSELLANLESVQVSSHQTTAFSFDLPGHAVKVM